MTNKLDADDKAALLVACIIAALIVGVLTVMTWGFVEIIQAIVHYLNSH